MSYLRSRLELKGLENGQFEGYGSVFGNVDLGGDIVVEGAFSKSLERHRDEKSMPAMFWMHQPDKVPGKWLKMGEDSHGLTVKGELAPTPLGDEMQTLLKMDAIRGLSIGYQTTDYDFDRKGNRLIKAADLHEVSIVSMAMNPEAQVAMMKRAYESYLIRDVKMSHATAKSVVSGVFELRDVVEDEEEDIKAALESLQRFDKAAISTLTERFL